MNLFAFLIGVLLPTLNGTLALRLVEGKWTVLARMERLALGCMIGITLTMYLVFLLHILSGAPLVLITFLSVQILCSIILLILCHYFKVLPLLFESVFTEKEPLSRLMIGITTVIGLWMLAKILIATTAFLLLSPTFLDDSLDNWNMRGKLYFVNHELTLVLPNEDPLTSPKGVSSYPPTVPLMKTWLATIKGDWNEPLVNSVQVVWYLSALILLYFAIRRHTGRVWAIFGTYILGSIPLYLIHGTNAYADTFLSVHVFAAISMLFHALHAKTSHERMTFLHIGALATALLPFTKNEAMLVYLPPLLLLLCIALWQMHRTAVLSTSQLLHVIFRYGIGLLCVAGPWLLWKWSNGLTFGNGKSFTGLGFGWQKNVLQAIFVNTFFEGNWLLLFPLLFALIVWKWRAAFSNYALLTSFFLMMYVGQGLLYLFTGLSTEALRQTGYARGLVQLMPTIILLTTLLLSKAYPAVPNALAQKREMATD